MELDVYFHPEKPNLAEAFDLDGLCPVLKEKEGPSYLLTDRENRFYIFNPEDGRMFVYKEGFTRENVIDDVLSGVNWVNLNQQFNKKIPLDH